jgi:TRAP-type uncharacterized transport system substrate-binding protein
VLVTSSRQPEDLAYGIVKGVFDNLDIFRRLHPVLATLNIKDMVPSEAVIPIHPGALKYYREAGFIQSEGPPRILSVFHPSSVKKQL